MNLRAKPLSALMTAFLVLVLSGCGKSPEQHLQHGNEFVQKADYKSAAIELKSALQAQPSNREARLLLGQVQYHLGAYADAEKELSKARELGATDDQVLPLLTMSQLRMGNAKKVISLTIPANGLSPSSLATLHTARAWALLESGKRPEANISLAAAQQADPKQPDLLLLQAKLALAENRVDQAAQFVESALQDNPKSAEALYLKAAIQQIHDKPDEAIKIYRQIIANDPTEFRAHLAIASLEFKKGAFDAAEQSIQAAEKVAGNSLEVRYARGLYELQRGKLSNASSALLDVLRVAPDHLPSALAYAMASYGQGQYEQGLKYAEKVLAALPDNLIAAKIVAGSQIKIGNIKGALATLNPLLARHSNDAKLLAMTGDAYLQAKDYTKAMNYLDKAAELDPENAAIRARQAAGHLATGDKREAIAELEKAATLTDKPGQVDLALVMLHLKDKEYDKALQAIKMLEKKLPTNPVTHNLRAAALLGKKDMAGARDALLQALAIQPTFFPAAVNLARMDMIEKKPDDARKRFESVLAQDKSNVKAMLALAELAAVEKKEKAFVEWLEKAIKADPKSLIAYQQLIRHHLSKKENAKALTQARLAVNANPDNLAALNMLGATQRATGESGPALETYTRMTQKAPQSPDALLLLAHAQISSKQFAAARGSLQQALQLKPDFVKAQDASIQVELADNKPEAALAIARKMQAQQPKSPIGFDREGDVHLFLKRYPLAIKAYEQALAKAPGTVSLLKLHRALSVAGDTKAADQRLLGWLKQYPKDQAARNYAAEVFMFTNRNREAIAQYEELLKLRPNNVQALNNLAILYHREKNSRALATAEQAFKLAPEQPSLQDTLGWILVEQGQLPRGLDLLAKAATHAPKIAVIRYHYGVALMRSGKNAEAKKELATAIDMGQDFAEKEAAKTLLKSL